MALGNFAHRSGQSCSSLWVNLPIVVGKLYSCTSSLIIIVIFPARTFYIYTQLSQMGKLRSPFISLQLCKV